MNRGLIEATFPAGMGGMAAALPRFMNRGLIEAGEGLLGQAFVGNFPDS